MLRCRCMLTELCICVIGQRFILLFDEVTLSNMLSPKHSCEDLVDNVVFVCFLDEEVDIICWFPEKSDECGPSITVVD